MGVQGPLSVNGGDDPDPFDVPDLDSYLPVLLPGESSGHPLPATAPSTDEIESAQVDTLTVDDADSPANDPADVLGIDPLTGLDNLSGLGMDAGVTIDGMRFFGGIDYTGLEDLRIDLGSGADRFTIDTTHDGTTEIDGGAGDDTFNVVSLSGHTLIDGGAGNDTFDVDTASHLLTMLSALLALDGGSGNDTAVIDDSAETSAVDATLTQTSLTTSDVSARTSPDDLGRPLDEVYSVTPTADGSAYTLMLNATIGGITTGIGAVTVVAGESAAALQLALQLLLFPQTAGDDPGVSELCGSGTPPTTACAASVYVWQLGGEFLIGFRGEVNADPANPVTIGLTAIGSAVTLTGATAAFSTARQHGVEFAGLETMDVSLGSGDDVLNVQGTSAQTNVSLGAGDDSVFVSSLANEPLGAHPQFLAGELDGILGTLNLDFGTGDANSLLISDEASVAGDANVLMSDSVAEASARDAAVTAGEGFLGGAPEISLVGLATGSITWRAAADGRLDPGIRIWSGSGADSFAVDGTFYRAGTRQTTWLNTGLGDDNVTTGLTDGQDGFFVLDTQGPDNNELPLPTSLATGDGALIPASTVSVTVDGKPLDLSRFVVHGELDTVGLFDSLQPGDTVDVTLTTELVTQGFESGMQQVSLQPGDSARVFVNGVELCGPETQVCSVVGGVLSFDPGSAHDLGRADPATGEPADLTADDGPSYVVVDVTRTTAVPEFTVPASGPIADPALSDDDTVDASASTLPLVIFGGQGDDRITAGQGDDLVFGDRGLVLWFEQGAVPQLPLGDTALTPDQLIALEAAAVAVSGNGGTGDFTDAQDHLVGVAVTTAPTVGGNDNVSTGAGDDLVFGGDGADTVNAGDGQNIVLGDNGRYSANNSSTATWGTLPISAGILTTTDPADGGNDTITSGSGTDVILGGAGDDTIASGAGDDVVVGDHASLTFGAESGALELLKVAVIDDTIGGADTVHAGAGDDIVIGGTGDDRLDGGDGSDLVFGDNVTIDRTTNFGDFASLRFQTLDGTTIYDPTTGAVDLPPTAGATPENQPGGSAWWADFVIAFQDDDLLAQQTDQTAYGSDYIAGGGGDDMIFGELGDDTIQGDGSIDTADGTDAVGPCTAAQKASTDVIASRSAAGLCIIPSVVTADDGNDYIEGGGGNDTIFGDGGDDDIIGGSSDFFGRTTMEERPDGNDLIFGSTGADTGYSDNTPGTASDSDVIVGDNGDIVRLVDANDALLHFTYDSGLMPRAVVLLDYTPGGPDLVPTDFPGFTPADAATAGTGTVDVWGADEIHGGAGDDTIYAGGGNDVVYGDAGDDDIIGGWGDDFLDGGTGTDGILGDDGTILTSRNGMTEPLMGVTSANTEVTIADSGDKIQTTVLATGQLFKTLLEPADELNLTTADPTDPTVTMPAPKVENDVIFGGDGNDFLHGGAGSDAISGAEALPTSWAPGLDGTLVEVDWNHPFNDGTLLGFNSTTDEFTLYDPNDPRTRITLNADGTLNRTGDETYLFFLDNDASQGPLVPSCTAADKKGNCTQTSETASDGNDVIFGDLGNDWIVGGTGNDMLFGGTGDDLLNADDNLATDGFANDKPDTDSTYEDIAFGGAGYDVLIANTSGDSLIDWSGELNTFLVPFSPNGQPTISRNHSPSLQSLLTLLGVVEGADPLLTVSAGELGLVTSDQTGGPTDPQPVGHIEGGPIDQAPLPATYDPSAPTETVSGGTTPVTPTAGTVATTSGSGTTGNNGKGKGGGAGATSTTSATANAIAEAGSSRNGNGKKSGAVTISTLLASVRGYATSGQRQDASSLLLLLLLPLLLLVAASTARFSRRRRRQARLRLNT